jgi:predicted nucleotidyltransferase component of viral defense system
MIPASLITHWAGRVPWATRDQVEQDLMLSRLIIEIARNDLLGDELVFRGGTCLHKVHLPTPRRYSEDLDYVDVRAVPSARSSTRSAPLVAISASMRTPR